MNEENNNVGEVQQASGENQQTTVNNVNSNDPNSNKNLIIVGVFFLVMFVFIMFLPSINNFIVRKQEERLESQIKDPVEEDDNNESAIEYNTDGKEKNVTCISEETAMVDSSTMKIEHVYTHIDNKIKKVTVNMIYMYLSATDENFISQEKKCETEIEINKDHDGYSAKCILEDNTITVQETFDLSSFKTFTSSTGSTITSVVELDNSLKDEVNKLVNQGYTCK